MAVSIDPTLPVARVTLELWHGMIDAGLLDQARVELIAGVMVEMSPESPVHDDVIQVLTRLLGRACLDADLDLRVQSAMTIAGSEPEPDLAVVRRDRTRGEHPSTAELVVEVAVTSHRLDRGVKAELYAQSGVPEYWIVDVPGRAIERLTTPVDGRYTVEECHAADATVAPTALPSARLAVGDLLPEVPGGRDR